MQHYIVEFQKKRAEGGQFFHLSIPVDRGKRGKARAVAGASRTEEETTRGTH